MVGYAGVGETAGDCRRASSIGGDITPQNLFWAASYEYLCLSPGEETVRPPVVWRGTGKRGVQPVDVRRACGPSLMPRTRIVVRPALVAIEMCISLIEEVGMMG